MNVQITSKRERILWVFLCLSLAGLYGSIGFVQPISELLDPQTIGLLFWIGLIMVLLSIVTQGFKIKPKGLEIWIGVGMIAVYIILGVRMFVPERSHLIEYSIVALIFYEIFRERKSNGILLRSPVLAAILCTTLTGLIDELIQIPVPHRVFDWFDVLFDFLAACMAVIGSFILGWIRNKFIKRNSN